jgi:hypothetical protein
LPVTLPLPTAVGLVAETVVAPVPELSELPEPPHPAKASAAIIAIAPSFMDGRLSAEGSVGLGF